MLSPQTVFNHLGDVKGVTYPGYDLEYHLQLVHTSIDAGDDNTFNPYQVYVYSIRIAQT